MFKKLQAKAEKMVFQEKQPEPAATTPAPADGAASRDIAAPAPADPATAPAAPATTATPTDAAAAATPSETPAAAAADPATGAVPQSEQVTNVEEMGNGTTITTYADGHKTTRYPNGVVKNEYADGSWTQTHPNGTVTHHSPTVAKEDYLDKAFMKGARTLGFNLSREDSEKMTDKGRGFFEKKTGKKFNSKFSN